MQNSLVAVLMNAANGQPKDPELIEGRYLLDEC